MKSAKLSKQDAARLHYHVYPTPLASKHRWVARELRRRLERDQIAGRVPSELATTKLEVRACVGVCMDAPAEGSPSA